MFAVTRVTSATIITTIGLRISGYGAAEVFIDFAEELKHTDAHPFNSAKPCYGRDGKARARCP